MITIFTIYNEYLSAILNLTLTISMLIGLAHLAAGGIWLFLWVSWYVAEAIILHLQLDREFAAFMWQRARQRKAKELKSEGKP